MNDSVDDALAPPKGDPRAVYRDVLRSIEFDRALHLGSGRDKRGTFGRLSNTGEVVALDVDAEGLSRNPANLRVRGDGSRLPLATDAFGIVVSEYVFEHLPDPWGTLDEIDRILKPGGSFVVMVPNPSHYYAQIADATPHWFHEAWLKLMGKETTDVDTFPTQYEWGTLGDLRETADRFDWAVEELESFPGPTGYTKILPFHAAFALLDRGLSRWWKYHRSYVVHYRTSE